MHVTGEILPKGRQEVLSSEALLHSRRVVAVCMHAMPATDLTEPIVRMPPAGTATLVQQGTPCPSSWAVNSAPASATTAGAWNFSVGPALQETIWRGSAVDSRHRSVNFVQNQKSYVQNQRSYDATSSELARYGAYVQQAAEVSSSQKDSRGLHQGYRSFLLWKFPSIRGGLTGLHCTILHDPLLVHRKEACTSKRSMHVKRRLYRHSPSKAPSGGCQVLMARLS